MTTFLNIDTAKSYSTEANLEKSLVRLNLSAVRHMVVCNREGRFTPLFMVSVGDGTMYHAGDIAQLGFKVIG